MPFTLASGLGIAAAGCCLIGIILAHFGIVRPFTGFLWFLLGCVLGYPASVAAIWGWLSSPPDAAAEYLGLLGVLPALALAVGVAGLFRFPIINDVSTDFAAPPDFAYTAALPENAGRNLDFPAINAAIIQRRYPEIAPLRWALPPADAFDRVRRVALQQPRWKIAREDACAGILEIEARTGLFRFCDDVLLRVRPESDGSRIDMRSKSRVGRSDFGQNAKRINAFLTALRVTAEP